ncbi:hypothetical protein [Novosphingobium olei]|uniref:Uncharacterized protein n=1 Tax=Novosphingobium olei TaxID=2728851 RepID=A0A7Y0GB24_9SPHN|nr:hypothetical protein [Novosphingobium olei]NML94733.1 hypothetical protein [Novosphingobium olei]
MSPEDFAYRRTYRLPRGYQVEFVWHAGTFSAQWDPALPLRRLGLKLFPHYQRARDDFIASLDLPIVVVDL